MRGQAGAVMGDGSGMVERRGKASGGGKKGGGREARLGGRGGGDDPSTDPSTCGCVLAYDVAGVPVQKLCCSL